MGLSTAENSPKHQSSSFSHKSSFKLSLRKCQVGLQCYRPNIVCHLEQSFHAPTNGHREEKKPVVFNDALSKGCERRSAE